VHRVWLLLPALALILGLVAALTAASAFAFQRRPLRARLRLR
jgi:hypothetical protein